MLIKEKLLELKTSQLDIFILFHFNYITCLSVEVLSTFAWSYLYHRIVWHLKESMNNVNRVLWKDKRYPMNISRYLQTVILTSEVKIERQIEYEHIQDLITLHNTSFNKIFVSFVLLCHQFISDLILIWNRSIDSLIDFFQFYSGNM